VGLNRPIFVRQPDQSKERDQLVKRHLLAVVAALGLVFTPGVFRAAEAERSSRPNVLFILVDDIGEQHDLALHEAARTTQLWAELQAWLKETGAKIPQPYPQYQEVWAKQQWTSSLAAKGRLEKSHAAYLDPGWQPDPTWWRSLVPADERKA
jgi:hypothetical protein